MHPRPNPIGKQPRIRDAARIGLGSSKFKNEEGVERCGGEAVADPAPNLRNMERHTGVSPSGSGCPGGDVTYTEPQLPKTDPAANSRTKKA